jgi:hypothetical protein
MEISLTIPSTRSFTPTADAEISSVPSLIPRTSSAPLSVPSIHPAVDATM